MDVEPGCRGPCLSVPWTVSLPTIPGTQEYGRQCPLGREPCGEHGGGGLVLTAGPGSGLRGGRTTARPASDLQVCQGLCGRPARPWPAGALPQGRERQRQPMAPSTAGLKAAHGLTSLPRGRGPGRKPCLSPASGPASNVHPPWILWRHGHQDVTFQVWAPGEEGSEVGGERGRRE